MIKSVYFISHILLLVLICRTTNGSSDSPSQKFEDGKSDEIIDPNSLYYNKQTKRLTTASKQRPNINNDEMKDINLHQVCNQVLNDDLNHRRNDIFEESFSRRLINALLSSVDFEENDNNLLTGSLIIELTSSELRKLKDFGLGKARIRDVDPIITSIFRAAEKNSFYDIYLFVRNICVYLIMHKEIVIITCIVLYLTWLLLTVKWHITKFFQASLFIIFITSFVMVYFQLLKDAEIKLTAKQVLHSELPVHCRPHLMSWWEKVWHMYGTFEDCQNYYEAREDSHFLHVTPAIALSHMISTFMLHPAETFGDAISKFVHQTTKNFWTPLQIIFTPLMTIAIIVLLVVAFICVAGGSFRWYMWPFTVFSFGRSPRNDEAQSLSSKDERKPIEVILNIKTFLNTQSDQLAIDSALKNDSNLSIPINTKQQELLENNTAEENSSISNSEQTSSSLHIPLNCSPENIDSNKNKIEEVKICSSSSDN